MELVGKQSFILAFVGIVIGNTKVVDLHLSIFYRKKEEGNISIPFVKEIMNHCKESCN